MSFSIATAISRISGEMEPVWTPGSTSDQQVQRINEVLERFWVRGTWDGLLADIAPTSSSSIIILDAAYKTIEVLGIPAWSLNIMPKSQQWKASPSAPRVSDWTQFTGEKYCFDLGDISGQRHYQLTGPSSVNDALTFTAIARRRYTWTTDTSTIVAPDCFQALLAGVRAFHWYDVGDNTRANLEFNDALLLLTQDEEDVLDEEDLGTVSLLQETSGGNILNII